MSASLIENLPTNAGFHYLHGQKQGLEKLQIRQVWFAGEDSVPAGCPLARF
jgi:hypothetical protein